VLQPVGQVRLTPADETVDRIRPRGGDALFDRIGQLAEDAQHDGHDDRVPVGEVRIDRRGRDPDLPRHGAQRDGLVGARPLDQRQRTRHDVVGQPDALPACVPPPVRAFRRNR
jgi:hypothetical protein